MNFGIEQVGTAVAILVSAAAALGTFRKGGSEARKIDMDSATALVDAGVRVATARTDELEQIKDDLAGVLRRERERERLAVQHERWDLDVVDQLRRLGGAVTDPPPLFIDETT
jgi:hypothetical protein